MRAFTLIIKPPQTLWPPHGWHSGREKKITFTAISFTLIKSNNAIMLNGLFVGENKTIYKRCAKFKRKCISIIVLFA